MAKVVRLDPINQKKSIKTNDKMFSFFNLYMQLRI